VLRDGAFVGGEHEEVHAIELVAEVAPCCACFGLGGA
jgi:hypothetical protein